jgi:hypothetical protein
LREEYFFSHQIPQPILCAFAPLREATFCVSSQIFGVKQPPLTNHFARRSWSYYLTVPLLSILFLVFVKITTGLRFDHFLLVTIVNIAFYASGFSRRLITGLGIIIFYWILFDSMKAWPNYAYNTVHIQSLYELEKSIFGFMYNGVRITPNEYFLANHTTVPDLICAAFYLCWVPVPLLFAFYLYFTNKNLFLRFCFAFLFVNLLGFVIYYSYPAAPPWYIAERGMQLDITTKSYAAGLLRFDHFFGINLFSDLYAKGSNVFAAMPSLHASYPLIGLFYAIRQPRKWIAVIFAIVMVGIWFAAIYLTHHYILDILAGIACGLTGLFIFEKYLLKTKWFGNFVKRYEKTITKPMEKNYK